jgi:uncharacterized RDD family membrane protein YckC
MSQDPDPGAAAVRRGYEQFAPPVVPPGMYLDRRSRLIMPRGVRLASPGRVIASYCLGLSLFAATLGIGYLIWSVRVWGEGHTPAQRMLGMRCWQPETGRLADRGEMALRQVSGILLNGQLLCGLWLLLFTRKRKTVGDLLADTVVLHDPGWVLRPR